MSPTDTHDVWRDIIFFVVVIDCHPQGWSIEYGRFKSEKQLATC